MEEKWAVLEKVIKEFYEEEWSPEEKEFLMARALHLINSMKEYYIGVKA